MTTSSKNFKETGNKAFLEVFGFISNQARMNLVVFFICILLFSNMYFIYRNTALNKEIRKVESEKVQLILDLNKQVADEIRKQVKPATYQIQQTIQKLDSITEQTNNKLNNANK